MKTFDKQGRISKAAQKTRFPKYVAYIDCSGTSGIDVFEKAMVETDLLEAMRTLENAVNKRKKDVYLCGIYQKTDEINECGGPIYKMVIGARMNETRLGEIGLSGWHFWDKEHGESPHPPSLWVSRDFGKDNIDEWDRNGKLIGI